MIRKIVAWSVLVVAASTAPAEQPFERMSAWPDLEEAVTERLDGFVVPALKTVQWKGFVNEGDRIRGEAAGDSFTHVVDQPGRFFLGLVLVDDPDGTERLEVSLNGNPLGVIVADASGGKALFAMNTALDLNEGDELRFTCLEFVGCYRIFELVFAREPIVPPTPVFHSIEPWVTKDGVVDLCWTTSAQAPTGEVEYGYAESKTRTSWMADSGRNHRIRLTGLDPDTTYEGRIITEHRGKQITSEPFSFRAKPPVAPSTKRFVVAISVPEPTDAPRHAWPATVGMPFAKGQVARPEDVRLFDEKGNPVALQKERTCSWPDGSVKWMTLSFLADSSREGTTYHLEARPDWPVEEADAEPAATMEPTHTGWMVRCGALAFELSAAEAVLFKNLTVDGSTPALGDAAALVAQLPEGTELRGGPPTAESFHVEANGPCQAVLKWSGAFQDAQGPTDWTYLVRVTLRKGPPILAIDVAVCNENTAEEFDSLRSLALRLPNTREGGLRVAFDDREAIDLAEGAMVTLLQDKDNHFAIRCGNDLEEGTRATGTLTLGTGSHGAAIHMREFWETYPSGWTVSPQGIEAQWLPPLPPGLYSDEESKGLFPYLYAWFESGNYLFRTGQVTRQEVQLCFGDAAAPEMAMQHRAWLANPLLPQAPSEYLCATGVLGRPIFPRTQGTWDEYDALYEKSFDRTARNTAEWRTYGWMNHGDWRFEDMTYGNNEYDLAWSTGLQWMRTGERRFFDRGLAMARHYSSVDTVHGRAAENAPCLAWKHCFNHVGAGRPPLELCFTEKDRAAAVQSPGLFHKGSDPQGHVFQEGLWLYGALTGDRWLTDTAAHVCTWQAECLTPNFDFEIERGGGWPLICAVSAYEFSGNPFYLNAARIMVERCVQRHDPEHGGWPHTPPINETDGVPVRGGKAFASGILTFGLLRYLDIEPRPRPEVRQMLVNTARWLKDESWAPGGGFVYITNAPNQQEGSRGNVCLMIAEVIAFAFEETGDETYRDFLKTILAGTLDGPGHAIGKTFTMQTRQTVFGLDRARRIGIIQADSIPAE